MEKIQFYKEVRDAVAKRERLIQLYLIIGPDVCPLGARGLDLQPEWAQIYKNWRSVCLHLLRPSPPEVHKFMVLCYNNFEYECEIAHENDIFCGTPEARRNHMLAWLDQAIAKMDGSSLPESKELDQDLLQ